MDSYVNHQLVIVLVKMEALIMFETLNDLKISFLLVILVGILSFANSSILNLPLELRLNGLLVFAVMSPVSISFLTWIFATAAGIKNKIAVVVLG